MNNVAEISMVPVRKKSKQEDLKANLKFAIAMLGRKIEAAKRNKEGPHTASMIKTLESRTKKLKYDLAELEG